MIWKEIIRQCNRLFFKTCTRITIQGREHIPFKTGKFIIASNHLGRLDALVIYHILDRKDLIVMAAEKYQEHFFTRWVGNQMKVIWIDRFHADFQALRKIYRRLNQGGLLVMAPEGTRSPTGALLPGRRGAAYLAAKTSTPVIPAAITGTEDRLVAARLKRFERVPINLAVGEPFSLPPLPHQNWEDALKKYTDEIMCRIASLLPARYRGVYADHPRLHELLGGLSSG